MQLNKYFQNQVDSNNCQFLPEDLKGRVLSDFNIMSMLGIDNDADQNKFFIIRNHVPEIANNIFKLKLNEKTAQIVAALVFKNREKKPIGTLLELIEAIDLALNKMMPNRIRPKLAYPQGNVQSILPQYDINRWVSATREIYNLVRKGHGQAEAKKTIIGNWESREQMDYEQWLRFYKERVPEKYPKLASFADEPLFLANLPLGIRQQERKPDINDARETIEQQRRKLIGRLNSAEKLLASMEGQLFAGEDQELMLKLIHDLKRRIQTANKLTAKSSLFEDFIVRTANNLQLKGKEKAAGFFYKMAQLPPLPGLDDLGGGMDMPTEPEEEPATVEGDSSATHEALKKFFDNLRRGVADPNDTLDEIEEEKQDKEKKPTPPVQETPPQPSSETPPPAAEPTSEASPDEPAEEVPAKDTSATASDIFDEVIKLGEFLSKKAQIPPMPTKPVPAPLKPAPVVTPPVSAQPIPEINNNIKDTEDHTEDAIEAAIKNITIQDIIHRLETVVAVYSQREISRQLAFIDIMLDRKGIASYFPQFGEAQAKALEANQYIGNRLEDVLGKLKGSLQFAGSDKMLEVQTKPHPDTENIISNLEQEKQDEVRRKELRKQKEIEKFDQQQKPEGMIEEVELPEEPALRQPSRVEKSPPIRTR